MSKLKFLKSGDKAPNFELENENGDLVKLSDFKGKALVIYFYPKDNTPTCTVEACNLRDNYKALTKAGYKNEQRLWSLGIQEVYGKRIRWYASFYFFN